MTLKRHDKGLTIMYDITHATLYQLVELKWQLSDIHETLPYMKVCDKLT